MFCKKIARKEKQSDSNARTVLLHLKYLQCLGFQEKGNDLSEDDRLALRVSFHVVATSVGREG